ncbi:hypothetical protein G419_25387 [Rhodococcus triatomae BKS 15-14]|nr:hypothetical protein G419_25387 [Rhodococcus triatomae BKS 15-14]
MLFSDDFNRANGNVANGWVMVSSTNPTIVSQQIGQNAANNSGDRWALWPVDCLSDDQFSQCTIRGAATTSFESTLLLTLGASSTRATHVSAGLAGGRAYVLRNTTAANDASSSYVALSTGINPVDGDIARFEKTGNLYTLKINGASVVTWTDTSSTATVGSSNRRVGWSTRCGGTRQSFALDDWSGGDL